MSEPRPQMIAGPVQENLGLIFQAAKGPRMNDPRPVALELRPEDVPRLGIFSAARFAGLLGKGRQDADLVGLHLLPRFPGLPRAHGVGRIVGHTGIIGCSFGFASPELARGRLAGVLNFSDCAQLYREQMRGRPKKKTDRTRERVLSHGRWIVSGVCVFLAVIT